jgi:hypothetical protein
MRIIDQKTHTTLSKILIMLTPDEALELWSSIENIDYTKPNHIHVDDAEYKREITVAIYTDKNLQSFSEEVRKVIEEP